MEGKEITDIELRKIEEGKKEEYKRSPNASNSSNSKSVLQSSFKTNKLDKVPSVEDRKAAFQNHEYVKRSSTTKSSNRSSSNAKSQKNLSKSFRMATNKSFRIMTASSPALRKQSSRRLPLSTRDRTINVLLLIWHFLSPYRIMWIICMAINSAFLARAHIDKNSYFAKHTSDIALANILACIVVRNEVVLYGLYWIIVKMFKIWPPLWFRNFITSFLLHLGGVHSGLGTAGLMWIVYITVELFKKEEFTTRAILAISVIVALLLLVSIVGAFPLLRFYFHNQFELMHRFGGWSALAFLWAFLILSNNYNPLTKEYEFKGENFYEHQNFWYCVFITWFVVQPWLLFTRKVKVEIIVPSPKMCVVKFSKNIPAGTLARISRAPLLEWHAFGIISEPVDRLDLPRTTKELDTEPEEPVHYFLVTALGDFTKGLISNPPTEVWTRTFKFVGLPYCVPLYKSGVCVATGSGLGITLSSVLVETEQDIKKGFHLIWVARDIEKEFGSVIMGLIKRGDPKRLHVYDSKKGRPDVMKLLLALIKKIGAEVVFCTSNRSGTDYIIDGCKMNGITCFGPIFDS